jgi:uncharacterized protein (DUF2141 family)
MKQLKNLIVSLVIILTTTQFIEASTLTIHLKNVSEKGGNLMVAVFANENDWLQEGTYSAKQNAISPESIVTIEDVPPGTYAISVFQDIDENMALDANCLGIPKEPYGFSNDAPSYFGPPSWEKAIFTVTEGNNEVIIHL